MILINTALQNYKNQCLFIKTQQYIQQDQNAVYLNYTNQCNELYPQLLILDKNDLKPIEYLYKDGQLVIFAKSYQKFNIYTLNNKYQETNLDLDLSFQPDKQQLLQLTDEYISKFNNIYDNEWLQDHICNNQNQAYLNSKDKIWYKQPNLLLNQNNKKQMNYTKILDYIQGYIKFDASEESNIALIIKQSYGNLINNSQLGQMYKQQIYLNLISLIVPIYVMNKTIIQNEYQQQNLTLNNKYILLDAQIDELLLQKSNRQQLQKLINKYIKHTNVLGQNKQTQYTYFDISKLQSKNIFQNDINIMRINVAGNLFNQMGYNKSDNKQQHGGIGVMYQNIPYYYVFADSYQKLIQMKGSDMIMFCKQQLQVQYCQPPFKEDIDYGLFSFYNNFVCSNFNKTEHKHINQQTMDLIQQYLQHIDNESQYDSEQLYPFQLLVYFSIKCDKFQTDMARNFCFNQQFQQFQINQLQINDQLALQVPILKKQFEQITNYYDLFIYTTQQSLLQQNQQLNSQIITCMDSFLFRKTKYQDIIKQCTQYYDYIQHGQYLYDIEKQRLISVNSSLGQNYNFIKKYAKIYDNLSFTSTSNWCMNITDRLSDTYIYPNDKSIELWKIDQQFGLRVYNQNNKIFPLQINKYQQINYIGQYPENYFVYNNTQPFDFVVWRQSIDQTYIKVTNMAQKKLQVTCYLFDEGGHNFTYSFNVAKNDIRLIPSIMESYKTYQEQSQFQREFITCNGVTKQFDKKILDQNSYFTDLELDKFIYESRQKLKQNQAINEIELLSIQNNQKSLSIYIYLIGILITLFILQFIQ